MGKCIIWLVWRIDTLSYGVEINLFFSTPRLFRMLIILHIICGIRIYTRFVIITGTSVNDCSQFGAIWDEDHEVVAIFENEKGSSFTVLTRKNGEIWKTSLR